MLHWSSNSEANIIIVYLDYNVNNLQKEEAADEKLWGSSAAGGVGVRLNCGWLTVDQKGALLEPPQAQLAHTLQFVNKFLLEIKNSLVIRLKAADIWHVERHDMLPDGLNEPSETFAVLCSKRCL